MTHVPLGRTPPHNINAERGLVGIVLNDSTPSAAAVARSIGVRPASFYEPALRIIWEHIETMANAGEIPDLSALSLRLSAAQQMQNIGGFPYLTQITSGVHTSAHLRKFAEEIKLLWERRHAIQVATSFVESCYSTETAERSEFTRVSGELGNRLVMLGRVADVRTLADRVSDVIIDVNARAEGKEDRSRWLPTGMPVFDRVLMPFGSSKEDHFIGIAGGSGMGKSAIMRQWGHNWNRLGKRIVVYTRETSIDGWIEQAAAQAVGVDLMNLSQAPDDKMKAMNEELAWLRDHAANKLLFVYENDENTNLMTVEDICAHYRAFEHLHGKPDAVLVDYLQIIAPQKRCNSREQEVAHVSHTLQAECRRAGNVWIVGAQMNESGLKEQQTAKKDDAGRLQHRTPVPGDLRESQAFYHDADRMLCIYRPPEDYFGNIQGRSPPPTPEQWICQIKRRRGGTGAVKFWFERKFTRFVEFSKTQIIESQ
jgi:replicative DNA helicase